VPSARRLGARLSDLVGSDAASIRQGLAALLVSSAGDLLAGLTLGAITHTLSALPGLLVLVPAAIGMRGNVFGALGSRLGTAIHTGTFALSRRAGTVVGQNVLAALALSLSVSLALAVLAKAVAVGFGLAHTISVVDFVVISVVGGAVSSVFVLLLTLAVAAASARRGWDLDNVSAPLVTAAGDVVTLPSLFLATYLVGIRVVSPVLAVLTAALAVAALVGALRAGLPLLSRIVGESLPVLCVAGAIDVVAGLTIEKRLESFVAFPGLLVLIPRSSRTPGPWAASSPAVCRASSTWACSPLPPRPLARLGVTSSSPSSTPCPCSCSSPSPPISPPRWPAWPRPESPACWRWRCWAGCWLPASPSASPTTGRLPPSGSASTPTTTGSPSSPRRSTWSEPSP
jgi:mgtE-like transporter